MTKYTNMDSQDIKNQLAEMDWFQLLSALDDTIQIDIMKCGHDKWAKMIQDKRFYMLLTEELRKRLSKAEALTDTKAALQKKADFNLHTARDGFNRYSSQQMCYYWLGCAAGIITALNPDEPFADGELFEEAMRHVNEDIHKN